MATFDEKQGMWFEFRRLVTGRGATAADAKAAADRAEAALKAQMKNALPVKQRVRYSVLEKITGMAEK